MSVKPRYYLFFIFMGCAGAALCIWFQNKYGIVPDKTYADSIGGSIAFRNFLSFFCDMTKPFLLMFIAGFTLFAPSVSICVMLYTGFMCCNYSICYYKSSLGIPAFVMSLLFGAALIIINTKVAVMASAHRSHLKASAPAVSSFLHTPETRSFFICAVTAAAIEFAVCCAMYIFTVYFPV